MELRRAPRIPPPVILAAAMAVQRRLVPDVRASTGSKVCAGFLAIGGAVLAIGAESSFHAAKTTANPLHPEKSTSLVTSGIFAFTRNPMYLGMIALSAGYAFWRGSILAVIPVAAVFLWLDRLQIPAEEDALAEKYGNAYWQYLRTVPRWIPGVERGKSLAI